MDIEIREPVDFDIKRINTGDFGDKIELVLELDQGKIYSRLDSKEELRVLEKFFSKLQKAISDTDRQFPKNKFLK